MVVLERWHSQGYWWHCTSHESTACESKHQHHLECILLITIQAIINFATESYYGRHFGTPVPPIGKGIGLVFGLLLLQVVSSLSIHHFFYRSASTGVLVRGGLITAIYARSLRLTSRARSTLTNGKLVNHISTDVSRIDFCASWFHMVCSSANSLSQFSDCSSRVGLRLSSWSYASFYFSSTSAHLLLQVLLCSSYWVHYRQ